MIKRSVCQSRIFCICCVYMTHASVLADCGHKSSPTNSPSVICFVCLLNSSGRWCNGLVRLFPGRCSSIFKRKKKKNPKTFREHLHPHLKPSKVLNGVVHDGMTHTHTIQQFFEVGFHSCNNRTIWIISSVLRMLYFGSKPAELSRFHYRDRMKQIGLNYLSSRNRFIQVFVTFPFHCCLTV